MKKGFTLIELLVVVLIMGILASVALPQYFKSVEKGRAAEAINMLSEIASAEERYYMKTGSFIILVENGSDLREALDLDVKSDFYSYYTNSWVGGNPNGTEEMMLVAERKKHKRNFTLAAWVGMNFVCFLTIEEPLEPGLVLPPRQAAIHSCRNDIYFLHL